MAREPSTAAIQRSSVSPSLIVKATLAPLGSQSGLVWSPPASLSIGDLRP